MRRRTIGNGARPATIGAMSADEKRISGGKRTDTTPVAKPGDTALRPTDSASNIAEGKAGKESVRSGLGPGGWLGGVGE